MVFKYIPKRAWLYCFYFFINVQILFYVHVVSYISVIQSLDAIPHTILSQFSIRKYFQDFCSPFRTIWAYLINRKKQLWSTEITNIVYWITLFEKEWGKSMLDIVCSLLFDPKVLISYYLLFHMLFVMLCVLPTGFICHTVTAFHDKVSNCNARREACVWPILFL